MATLAELLKGYTPPTESALADPIKQHFKTLPAQTAANLLRQRQNIDQALTMGNNGIKVGNQQALNEFMSEVPGVAAMTAYHGTPHTIQGKFDISKVGTGEGAQAYGHGMYFAENPAVAKEYQEALSTYKTTIDGVPLTPDNPKFATAMQIASQGYETVLKNLQNAKNSKFIKPEIADKDIADVMSLKNAKIKSVKEGNLYKVDIPDEHIPMMLDYDKPIKSQPELYELMRNNIKDPDILKTFEHNAEKGITGANVYKNYIGGKTDAQRSANALNMGIKGIRYLDKESLRQTDSYLAKHGGTSNFVVFDPSTVKILEQNGQPTRKQLLEDQLNKVVE